MRFIVVIALLFWTFPSFAEPTPPKAEPAKAEPAKAEPAKAEPAKAAPVAETPAATPAPAATRAPVADFTLDTLKGESVKLSDYKGKVVVISFWASWCKPCKQELQHLDKMAEARKDDMVLLAVNTDDPSTVSEARKYIRRKKIKCPVPMDSDGAVMSDLNPRGSLPFSVYIDRKGGLHSTHDGFSSGDEIKIQAKVDALIAEK